MRFLLCLLLCGCTTFYGEPVQLENWPDLRMVEHRVPMREVRDACDKYAPAFYTPSACAIYYARECHVWAEAGESGENYAAIERDNCAGKIRPYWRARAMEIRDTINEQRAKYGQR